MNFEVLGLILDIAVLLALGAGVYFALKITRVLDNFKKARKEMNIMVQTLTQQIDLAEKAIQSLKYESYETADELRDLIKKAAPLAGELKVMTESGGHVADRLETAHTQSKNSAPAPFISGDSDIFEDDFTTDDGFAIQDHEYDDTQDGLESEAERELFKVLKGAGGRT